MTALFEALDANPLLYWGVAWTCFGLCAGSALLAGSGNEPAQPRNPAAHPALFACLIVATLCAFRWPSWFMPWQINPDESQIIAGALTLRETPVFWKAVDGTTHGPVNEYLLMLLSLLGWPLTFAGARVLAAGLIAGALIGVWGTLRRFLPEQLARLGILPGLAFWAFSWFGDFLHLSSELAAIFLLACAGWGLATALTAGSPSPWLLGATGVLLALVPLAKLQAAPLALLLGLGGLIILGWRRPAGWLKAAASLAGGAAGVVVALLVFLITFGLLAQFWISYVQSNLGYAAMGSHPWTEMPNHFFEFMTTGQSFSWFFYGSMAYALLHARSAWQEGTPTLRTALAAGWLGTGVSYFCILAPGREVAHYLQLLVLPVTLLTALHLSVTNDRERRLPTLLLFLLLAVAPQLQNRIVAAQEQLGHLAEFKAQPFSAGGAYIRERMRPGERLTVWGWNAQLHVETQLPQGTREAHTAFQIMDGPYRDFYRSRFLRDLQRRKPEWFVDAVGPKRFAFEYRHIDGHETIPELDQLIREQYALVAEVDSMRVYRRKTSLQP
ncbi:MAG: hypothetical protein HYV95_02445 [Opitutae bacterium]|nr:hypothetical protein [Opitutae bacterium]